MSMNAFRPLLARALLLGLLGLVLPGAKLAHAADSAEEARLKAAFVFNFIKFAEWPEGGAMRAGDSIELCVVGERPLDGQLDALAGRSVRGQTVRLRKWASGTAGRCDIAFVAAGEGGRPARLQQGNGREPVLTVADRPGFLEEGGVIELKLSGGRVRFDINLAAAREAGLRLSSQLLQLADRVVQ